MFDTLKYIYPNTVSASFANKIDLSLFVADLFMSVTCNKQPITVLNLVELRIIHTQVRSSVVPVERLVYDQFNNH